MPIAWLAFALSYSGRGGRLTLRNVSLLAVEPLFTLLLVFTNERHEAFWERRNPAVIEPVSWGPWFWVHTAYSYVIVGVGTVLLVRALVSSAHLYRGQRVVFMVGAFVPWVANAANVSGLVPVGYPDPSPFAFVVTGVAFLWALFRYGLLDVVPVARSAVIEGMRNGMVVLDARRVVDLNPAGELLLGATASEVVGRDAAGVVPGWDALRERCGDGEEGSEEATAPGNGPVPRTLELTVSSLRDRSGRNTGWLVLVRDVTELRRAEEELRRSERELAEEIGVVLPLGRRVLREAGPRVAEALPRGAVLPAPHRRGEHLGEADEAPRPDRGRPGRAAGERAGPEMLDTGDHGGLGAWGRGAPHRHPVRAQRPRGTLRPGRLRDGLLLPLLPQAHAHRHALEVDRSFVERLGKDAEDEVLVFGIVGVERGLGLKVLAEGVDTPEQLERVRALGCDLAQGFYYSKPLPAGAAGELLAADYRQR